MLKTPKSMLLEMCVKQQCGSPKFDSEEVMKIPSLWSCTCVLKMPPGNDGSGFTSEGSGGTKKEAEHAAAENMLNILATKDTESGRTPNTVSSSAVPSGNINIDDTPVSDTDDSELEGIPVSDLITLCRGNGLPEPVFKDSQKQGLNNTWIFTVTCSVGDISTKAGRRQRKQEAKTMAAFRVLCDLKSKGYVLETKKSRKAKNVKALACISNAGNSNNNNDERTNDEFDGEVTSTGSGSGGELFTQLNPESAAGIYRDECNELVQSSTCESSPGPGKIQNDTVEEMEIDDAEIKGLKRKLEDGDENSSFSDIKRKYEFGLGQWLTCAKETKECLKFVKDFSHIFQHFPSCPQLDIVLMMKQFHTKVNLEGGPENYLENVSRGLDVKLQYRKPVKLKDNGDGLRYCTFLTMTLPFKVEYLFQNSLCLDGCGKDEAESRSRAAFEALKLLRQMMIVD